jgi:hypothetical protein
MAVGSAEVLELVGAPGFADELQYYLIVLLCLGGPGGQDWAEALVEDVEVAGGWLVIAADLAGPPV